MGEIHDELWLRSPGGLLQLPGMPVTAFDWTLEENTFGVLHATGPVNMIDPALLTLDARLEVHRFLNGASLGIEGETQFLLRYWEIFEDEAGRELYNLEAYTPEYLLTGRTIDSWATTDAAFNTYTTKSGAADNVIKAFVYENLGAGAGYLYLSRVCAEVTVDPNLSLCTSITKSAAWANLYEVVRDICDRAYENGEWLGFGFTASGSGTGFTFHTYFNHRGVDHTAGTANEIIVSKEMGNLFAPSYSEDHRQEITRMRALGKGEGQSRWTAIALDYNRSNATPLSYREGKTENTQLISTATVSDLANAAMSAARPERGFTGGLVNVDQGLYGVRVKWGDLVTALYQGKSFPCRLNRVRGSWTRDGGEVLDIGLKGNIP